MSIIEEYAEATVLERTQDDSQANEQPVARVSFGTFVLRVPAPSEN